MPKLLLAITVMLTVLLQASPSYCGEQEEQAKLKKISRDIARLQESIKGDNQQLHHLAKSLKKNELAAAELSKKINALETNISQLNTELEQLYQRRSTLEASRKSQQTLIEQQITAAFHLGSEEPIKLLLNQENPAKVSRTLKYYDYFLKARGKKLAHYRDTLNQLQETEHSIATHQQELLDNRDDLKQQQLALTTQQQQRQKVLASLNQQIKASSQALGKLKTERSRLEKILAALQENLAKLSLPSSDKPFAAQRGKLPWPVAGRLSKSFGSKRHSHITWDGWLLSAKAGTPVKSIHHGRVVFSDYLRGHGLLMIIDHGDNYMSLYAHNQVLLKETGEWVLTGETIAKVGNTGGKIDYALYFEIRHKGKPSNPKRWLGKRG